MRKFIWLALLIAVGGLIAVLAQMPADYATAAGEEPTAESGAAASAAEENAPPAAEEISAAAPAAPAKPPAPNVTVESTNAAAETYELTLSDEQQNGAPVATNLISITLEQVPVSDVINMFTRLSGANIIVAGNFTNLYVTASLKNVEWKSALNLVLGSVNLSTIEDPSGIIMVVTSEMYAEKLKQIEETKPLVTRTFKPRYMNAVDLVEQIRNMKVLSPRGTIVTSQSREQDRANMKSSALTTTTIQNPAILTEVIVTDIKEYVDRVAELIRKLDRREPQVLIDARIIDVVTSDSKKLGFDWSMLDRFGVSAGLTDLKWTFSDKSQQINTENKQDSQYDRRSNNDGVNKRYDISGQQYEESVTTYEEQPPGSGNWVSRTVVTPTRTITDTILRGRDVTSTKGDQSTDQRDEVKMGAAFMTVSQASLFLSALKKDSRANMISHPVLIVGNKVEAKIHVGQRYPTVFSQKTTDTSSGISRDSYSETVEWNDLGLTLWVIPEIDLEADVVRLTVNPQMSTWVKDITTPQGSVYPVISTRHLSSRVNVPSSHTVVIGGLMEDTKTKKETRVPILGDIPLIGLLFRHTEDTVDRSNLLIMLTPSILDETEPLTGLEQIGRQAMEEFDYIPLAAKKAMPAAATNAVSTNAPADAATSAASTNSTAPTAENAAP